MSIDQLKLTSGCFYKIQEMLSFDTPLPPIPSAISTLIGNLKPLMVCPLLLICELSNEAVCRDSELYRLAKLQLSRSPALGIAEEHLNFNFFPQIRDLISACS